MEDIIQTMLDEDIIVFVVGGALGGIAIVFGTVSGMVKSTARERTKREIAAYIAEGSMTPEQGEKLLNAGKKDD